MNGVKCQDARPYQNDRQVITSPTWSCLCYNLPLLQLAAVSTCPSEGIAVKKDNLVEHITEIYQNYFSCEVIPSNATLTLRII